MPVTQFDRRDAAVAAATHFAAAAHKRCLPIAVHEQHHSPPPSPPCATPHCSPLATSLESKAAVHPGLRGVGFILSPDTRAFPKAAQDRRSFTYQLAATKLSESRLSTRPSHRLRASDITLPSPQQHRIFFISTSAFWGQRHLLLSIATDTRSRHLDALTSRITRPVTRTSSHRHRCRCHRVSPLVWQTAHTRLTPGLITL